mgnify:CR=1 FL=1
MSNRTYTEITILASSIANALPFFADLTLEEDKKANATLEDVINSPYVTFKRNDDDGTLVFIFNYLRNGSCLDTSALTQEQIPFLVTHVGGFYGAHYDEDGDYDSIESEEGQSLDFTYHVGEILEKISKLTNSTEIKETIANLNRYPDEIDWEIQKDYA